MNDSRPRLFHPLCGANAGTIASLGRHAAGMTWSGRARLAVAGLAALGRLPVTLAERLGPARFGAEASMSQDPIFIVGHWRSGTTHLYNVMSRSEAFGYVSPIATGLPWDFLLLDRMLGPLLRATLPSDRFIDRIPVKPDSPQEDEIALANMQRLSFYHGLYLPQRFDAEFDRGIFLDGASESDIDRWARRVKHFYKKLERKQPGRRLLIKNPVYTARVGLIRRVFPGAKFIHIYRDPRRVLPSMRNFYAVLFRQLGLQAADGVDIDEIILRAYPRMMERLFADAAGLPDGDIAHVRFEDFEKTPLDEARRIYDALALDGFERDRPAYEEYVASVKGYKKNTYRADPEIERLVRDRWGDWLERLGYDNAVPAASERDAPVPA